MTGASFDSDIKTRRHVAAQPPATPDPEDIATGDVLADGTYRVEGMLGQGGMASVFRAKDLRSGREVALKVIAKRYVGRLDREKRFENEGRLAARLTGHRNIAAPLAFGKLTDPGQEGRMYLAMELARGPTLLDLVSMHGTLPVADAMIYIRDVARALRDLHAGGVVHRDVKPSNVIVVETPDGPIAKLVDFGLASDIETDAEDDGRLTKAGERPGTHHYMSPEQAWGAPAHPIFDVYALGATFYELLTGEPPWHDLSPADVMRRKCDLNLPSPKVEDKRQALPPGLGELVDDCLKAKAAERIPSASRFLERLDELRNNAGVPSHRPATSTGVVGVARTIDQKAREPRLKKIVAEAAVAKAQGRPGPVELTPIRTGATRPEMAADRADWPEADAAQPIVTGATIPAAAARGHTQVVQVAAPPSSRMRGVWLGLAAGLAIGLGGLAAWWLTSDKADAKAGTQAEAGEAGEPDASVGGDGEGDDAGDEAKVAANTEPAADDDEGATPQAETTAAKDGATPAGETDAGSDGGDAAPTAATDDGGDEPTADDDGTPVPKDPKNPKDPGPTPPATDEWNETRCAAERQAADKAVGARRWAGALEHTRVGKCWPDKAARTKIRVQAYFELSRYDDCVNAGAGSSDSTVQRTVRRCEKARDAGK